MKNFCRRKGAEQGSYTNEDLIVAKSLSLEDGRGLSCRLPHSADQVIPDCLVQIPFLGVLKLS